MNTAEMYDVLWNDCKSRDFVMAIAPDKVLPYVNHDERDSCYIIYVNTDGIKLYSRTVTVGRNGPESPGGGGSDCLTVDDLRDGGPGFADTSPSHLGPADIPDGRRSRKTTGKGGRRRRRRYSATTGVAKRHSGYVGSSGTVHGGDPSKSNLHGRYGCSGSDEPGTITRGHQGASGRTSNVGGMAGGVGHWLVLTLTFGEVEIFDSLGKVSPVSYGKEMSDFIEKHSCRMVNDELIDTKNCGYYCLLYVFFRSRGERPRTIVNMLKRLGNERVKKECLNVYNISSQ